MLEKKVVRNSKEYIRRLSKESGRKSRDSDRYLSKISERDMTMEKYKKEDPSDDYDFYKIFKS